MKENMTLESLSIALGMFGCIFVVVSFMFHLRDARSVPWGTVVTQAVACLALGSSALINVHLYGPINAAFVAANVIVLLQFLVIAVLKIQ